MSAAAASGTADHLLPRDMHEAYKTGEVLELEFKLIHGEDAWDPAHLKKDIGRSRLIKQVKDHLPPVPDLPSTATEVEKRAVAEERKQAEAEAERLALHTWSVRNLPDPGQAALCLSGGGIRSAAFALGILQGLARRNLLRRFHYLSTVSGGGYIGSWLTAWRHREGDDPVQRCLSGRERRVRRTQPMQRLRFNQNFLTPKVGLLSADTWAVLGTVLRNLLLNWLVFLPLLAGLLLLPRIVQAFLHLMDGYDPFDPTPAAYPSVRTLLSYLWVPRATGEWLAGVTELGNWRSWADSAAVALVVLGFSVSAYHRPESGQTTMTQGGFVRWVVVPVMAGAILLTGAIAAWLPQMSGSATELLRWVYFGMLVYVLARLIAAICALPAPQPGVAVAQIGVSAGASRLGGRRHVHGVIDRHRSPALPQLGRARRPRLRVGADSRDLRSALDHLRLSAGRSDLCRGDEPAALWRARPRVAGPSGRLVRHFRGDLSRLFLAGVVRLGLDQPRLVSGWRGRRRAALDCRRARSADAPPRRRARRRSGSR